ncbi:hypothetical protein THRCLA_07905 [Thraustotheca clavata]|uniref:EFHB C-terminal EF-hand domain-containing protein n=1 Tax=Thraustotheca clavata TaxID=74557 RepID=A0A1V9ZBV5_9STRA|nr:hypothetical protein THRCLA_07905 [Thraustotheca clavata]
MHHRQTLPPNAGKKQTPSANESTANCLSFDTRPITPEGVRKYRKSYFAEPGTRIVHSGLIDDMKHIDTTKKYGITTRNSDHVDIDIMPARIPSDHALITQAKLEAVYQSTKREPLGKSYTRGHVYSQTIFGAPPPEITDTTKELIYTAPYNETTEAKALYKRSHGASDPGEQKNRGYQVPIDLNTTRFGAQKVKNDGGVSSALNPELDEQVSKLTITSKNVEDMKSTMDQLGRPRNLGYNRAHENNDHVFGVKLPKDGAGAGDCIQGHYSFEEQQPDSDLGRPVNRGWMNATADDRSFGVPSIRSDVVPPQKRSLADAQNYGDDVAAQELLYPQHYSSLGVQDTEFSQPRTKQYLADLFAKIGYKLPAAVVDRLYANAGGTTPRGVSIQAFRDALNDYLDSEDNNPRK